MRHWMPCGPAGPAWRLAALKPSSCRLMSEKSPASTTRRAWLRPRAATAASPGVPSNKRGSRATSRGAGKIRGGTYRRLRRHQHLGNSRKRTGLSPAQQRDRKAAGRFRLCQTAQHFFRRRFRGGLLGLEGPAVVFSSACATTAKVFGTAARMIAAGLCDAAIVGGADTLCPTTLYGFHSLNLHVARSPAGHSIAIATASRSAKPAGFALLEKAARRSRTGADDSGAAARRRRKQRRLSHVVAASRRRRRAAGDGAGARRCRARAARHRLCQPARHRDAGRRRRRGSSRYADLFGTDNAVQLDQGLYRPYARRAGDRRSDLLRLGHPAWHAAGQPAYRRPSIPASRAATCSQRQKARIDRVMSNSFGFGGSNCSLLLGTSLT